MYRDHGAMVLRRIKRFYRGDEAEEVLQEIFIRVLTTDAVFRGEASTVTWLYRLTTRYCLNRLRNARRREELLDQHGTPSWGVGIASPPQESRVFLEQLWRTLDEELALVGVYYFVDGMSHAEIASAIRVSRRTVGNRIATLQQMAHDAAGIPPERS
jgi:RNA polymerase sigma-70 factor (ECF subfamily)